MIEWIKTTDRLPEKPGKERYEQIKCLIVYRGEVMIRFWNCEHLVWDDEDGDDYFCDPTKPSHWAICPSAPGDAA